MPVLLQIEHESSIVQVGADRIAELCFEGFVRMHSQDETSGESAPKLIIIPQFRELLQSFFIPNFFKMPLHERLKSFAREAAARRAVFI